MEPQDNGEMPTEEEMARMAAAWAEVDRFRQRFMFYARPIDAEEDALRAEIDELASTKVKPGDSPALLAQGFRVGECHRNCIAAEARGMGENVFGWTVTEQAYLSHSVLRMPDGTLRCITPDHTDELDAEGCYDFKEDKAFTYDGQYMRRNGEYLRQPGSVIRRGDVEAIRRHYLALEGRLLRGEVTFDDILRHDLTAIRGDTAAADPQR